MEQWLLQIEEESAELKARVLTEASDARESAAKAICASCPVMMQCAAHALAVREPYGVWGGLSEDDRDAIYAGRRRLPEAV